MRLALAALAAFAVADCDSIAPAPAPAPAAARPAVGRDEGQIAHPSAPPAPQAPPPIAPPPPPHVVEIEVRGTVDTDGAPPGRAFVVITDGPCFESGSHYIGSMPVRTGKPYFVEVFPPLGTRLDVCAAVVVDGRRTTPWHGRAKKAPLLAVGTGDVEWTGMDIRIRRGDPITVPATLKIE